ncbi:DUF86 domain-containing protein [Ammoniphilus sp. YIM 78166]|uniref:type VII toxin-antitoxin system HepT family RNase toxin n=1 Tax=Ammoniphilus sp. YIM 78166 TaxID=1644106 RepID=UPI001F10D16F|nr:HepT-like ribonuclease domain-containing protein [Ammoniphilus sp. YIM 78166]
MAEKKLGLPQSSRNTFTFLKNKEIITSSLSSTMKAMVEFRNFAVHDYQEINLLILRKILDQHLVDVTQFTETILEA